ncbi:uncharacterized protein V1518DRAFT_287500 [Limtongia smithiae]|uniref:uncharacterized protein n=1 Tax=Limtongia smithiae TaxID=1125753 RepID=UPI0034CF66F8
MVHSLKHEIDHVDLSFGKDFFDEDGIFPDIVALPTADSVSGDSSILSSELSTPQIFSPEVYSVGTISSELNSPFDSPGDAMFTTASGNPDEWSSLFNDVQASFVPPLTMQAPVVAAEVPRTHGSTLKRAVSVSSDEGSASPDGVILTVDGSQLGISERKRKLVTSQSYARRPRAGPLPAIVVDGEDDVAVKRARNTLAARRSRERKMLRLTDLEQQVEELMQERENDKQRIRDLELEVNRLRNL